MFAYLNGGCASGAIGSLQRGKDGRLPCMPSRGLAVQRPRSRTRGQQGPAQRDPRCWRRRGYGFGGRPDQGLVAVNDADTCAQAADIVSLRKSGPSVVAAKRLHSDGPRPIAVQARVGRPQWR